MDYSSLNDKQRSAVTQSGGAAMVLAGPGSGKTTVITFRALCLIREMGAAPDSVLVITFTKSATEEMRRRFLKLSGGYGEAVTFSTFHALFYRILRQRRGGGAGDILGEDERREAVKRILKARGLETEEDFLKGALNEISRIKNDLIDIRYFNSMLLNAEDFQAVYGEYEGFKAETGKLDFDDMLVRCYDLLRSEPETLEAWQDRYRYILVDEFQDINAVQYLTVSMLAAKYGNIFIVGDDDQSIYRFRGAKPEFLRRFARDFPDAARIVLDINYRSTGQIVALCNQVISRNKSRFAKSVRDAGKTGPPVGVLRYEDSNAEAAGIAQIIRKILSGGGNPEEIAVIYRVNVQSRALTDAFMNAHVPYAVKDEAPGVYEHWIAGDIRAYLAAGRGDEASAARIINKPKRYISNIAVETAKKAEGNFFDNLYGQKILQMWQLTKLDELLRCLRAISGLSSGNAVKYIRQKADYDGYIREYSKYRGMSADGLFEILDELQEAARAFETPADFIAHMDEAVADAKRKKRENSREKSREKAPGVVLTTMHSAKGLEFETVFMAGAVEGYIPYEKSKTEAEIEEERRLFYVGLTRARVNLYISLVGSRHEKKTSPSRFLEGISLGRV